MYLSDMKDYNYIGKTLKVSIIKNKPPHQLKLEDKTKEIGAYSLPSTRLLMKRRHARIRRRTPKMEHSDY